MIYVHGRAVCLLQQGGHRDAPSPSRSRRRHALRRRRLRERSLRRLFSPIRRGLAPRTTQTSSRSPVIDEIYSQQVLATTSPTSNATARSCRRRPRFPPARRRQARRPLGGDLLEVRHRLRASKSTITRGLTARAIYSPESCQKVRIKAIPTSSSTRPCPDLYRSAGFFRCRSKVSERFVLGPGSDGWPVSSVGSAEHVRHNALEASELRRLLQLANPIRMILRRAAFLNFQSYAPAVLAGFDRRGNFRISRPIDNQ